MQRNVAAGISIATLLALGGCVQSAEDLEPAGLPSGLSVLEARPGSLSLAYREADVVIYMQALRGHRAPDSYQVEGEPTRFEVDARFTDADGHVFYSQTGGDGWVDEDWAYALDRQAELPLRVASNQVLFRLAGHASRTMLEDLEAQLGSELARELMPEIGAIHDFAEQAPDLYASMAEGEDLPVAPGEGGEVVYGTEGPEDGWRAFGAGTYYVQIHDAQLSGTLGLGYHSSTSIWHLNGAWYHVHNFCNHGSCGTTMPRKCSLPAIGRPVTWTAQTCTTGYSAWSDGGGHNCHDDTRAQMYNLIYGATVAGNAFWCDGRDDRSDISSNAWPWPSDQGGSPNCDSTTDRGYRHPSM